LRILITGARGFIGSFLLERLIADDHEVSCLLRKRRDNGWISNLPFTEIEGDITDIDSLRDAVKDKDIIYHLAGCTKTLRRTDFNLINVQGLRNLLNAVYKDSPRLEKFVHVSSLAAAGPSKTGKPLTENLACHPVSNYGKSKLESEHVAQSFMEKIPITIVRPPAVFGPRDEDVLSFFKQVKSGFIPVLRGEPRTVSFAYVENLVEGLVRAGESERSTNQTYYICEDEVWFWNDFGDLIASVMQVKASVIKLPVFASGLACLAGEVIAILVKRNMILNLDKFREIREIHWSCSNQKAKKELGFAPLVSMEKAIAKTVSWYKQTGRL